MSADQEFSNRKSQKTDGEAKLFQDDDWDNWWTNNWDNAHEPPPWNNYWSNSSLKLGKGKTGTDATNLKHDNWENSGTLAPPRQLGKRPLADLIRLRRDNDEYGFVQNLVTGKIFYAPSETLELLRGIMGKPVTELATESPEVLAALG